MLTISLPFKTTVENVKMIRELQKKYSPIIRTSYNRSMEGAKEKDIRHFCQNQFGQEDSWFLQCAVKEGMTYASTDKAANRKTRIFGGKKQLVQRNKNQITNEQWKEARIQPLAIIGEANACGNRKFKFDVISNNQIIFKMNKKNHLSLTLPRLRRVMKTTLENLELAMNSDILPVSIKLTSSKIYITYDELQLNRFISSFKPIVSIKNRHAGIDLNPNYIGLSVSDFNTMIHSELHDISRLTTKSGQSSASNQSKYLNRKLDFETIQLADKLAKTLSHLRVETLTLEDLKFDQSDKGLGRNFNRLTTNVWKRTLFINQLEKRCRLVGIQIKHIHPAYTSFIGNLTYELPDPISASLEISRRGTSEQFYPELKIKENLKNQWKEDLGSEFLKSINSWKELFAVIKNSKVKYRVPIPTDGFKAVASVRSKVMYKIYRNASNLHN